MLRNPCFKLICGIFRFINAMRRHNQKRYIRVYICTCDEKRLEHQWTDRSKSDSDSDSDSDINLFYDGTTLDTYWSIYRVPYIL